MQLSCFCRTASAELGYLTQCADGIFGPATRQAVAAFQQAQGLETDSIVGRATWKRCEAADRGAGTYLVKPGDTLWA